MNEILEGDVIMPQNERKVKSSKVQGIPLKQRKFIKYYKEGSTMGNGTKSAIKAGYSEKSAHVAASRILKSDKVLTLLNDSVEEAEGVISKLMRSDDEKIALAAAKETLDRTVGKAVQRTESVSVNITVESMLEDFES